MRLRNNPEAIKILEDEKDYVYIMPKEKKGLWHKVFNNENDIHIEIGMGKGDFIVQNAVQYPDINFIGIEKYSTVAEKALKKVMNHNKPQNLRLIKEDAKSLLEVFDKEEISVIYLNFSDPWPKSRHAKRRLTYPSFLDIYYDLLKKDGQLIFKTDNRSLFEYSLVTLSNYQGFEFVDVSLNLHNSIGYNNIETEYEKKFSIYGPIYRLEVRKVSKYG